MTTSSESSGVPWRMKRFLASLNKSTAMMKPIPARQAVAANHLTCLPQRDGAGQYEAIHVIPLFEFPASHNKRTPGVR